MIKAYLAGPDVFLPNAVEHARRKIEICARHGIIGLAPLNEDAGPADSSITTLEWTDIFRKDMEMMKASDIIIANLTPFRGASADAGTLVEIGWFLAGIIHQASFLIFLDGRCATRRRGGVTTHRPIWAGFGELGDVSALELAEIGTGRGQSPLSSDQQPGQSGQSVAENDLIRHRSRQMQAN